jgi:hypothetical protein
MIYFKKIEIHNFYQIQKELSEFVIDKFSDQTVRAAYDPSPSEMEIHCSTLHNWIIHHPPNGKLNPHIDGNSSNRSPIGLNIPIQGCKNSKMKWWDESTADMLDGHLGYGNMAGCKILNPTELTCLAETEINQPTFVRTDIIHSVENYNSIPRILLSVRWMHNKAKEHQFDDVLCL